MHLAAQLRTLEPTGLVAGARVVRHRFLGPGACSPTKLVEDERAPETSPPLATYTQRGHRERSGVTAESGEQREERFRDVYDSVRARVLAYALRRTSSPEDAADVVAETFAIAWRRLDDVPMGDDRILWFYATARRVLANHHRRVRRRDELIDRIGGELRCGLARVESVDSDRVTLLDAFRRLPEADRELLMLAGWDGLDSAELARLLGCSRTAVRIRLHRARARLTREMGTAESCRETAERSRTLTVTKATPEPDATSSFHAGRQKG